MSPDRDRVGSLTEALSRLAARGMLPSPTATDAKASGVAGNWTKESGRNAGATLTDVVVRKLDTKTHSPTSTSQHDKSSPTSSPTGERVGNGGGLLSPRFVEWMMGLPPGWVSTSGPPPTPTSFSSSETESFPTPPASRSPSYSTAWSGADDFGEPGDDDFG